MVGSICRVGPTQEGDQKVVQAYRIFLDVFSTLLGIYTVFTATFSTLSYFSAPLSHNS